MTRSTPVRSHTRRLPERLDTPVHRVLAAEIAKVRDSDFIGEVLAGALEIALADLAKEDRTRIEEPW